MTWTAEQADDGKIWAVEPHKFDGSHAEHVSQIDIVESARTSSGGFAPPYGGLLTGKYLGHNSETGHYVLTNFLEAEWNGFADLLFDFY